MLPNGYERICDDFERTTGHKLALRSALDEFVGQQFPIVEVLLDGIHVGGFGLPGGHSADEVVAALADAISRLLLDHPLADTLARNGHDVVHDRFSAELMVRTVEDIYDDGARAVRLRDAAAV